MRLKERRPPTASAAHACTSNTVYSTLPRYAGFLPVAPDARGAKVVAALRANLLTSLSMSTSTSGRDAGSAGRAGQGVTSNPATQCGVPALHSVPARLTCLRGRALLVRFGGAPLQAPPAPGRPVTQAERRLQAALRPRLLLLGGVRWQTRRPAGCQSRALHIWPGCARGRAAGLTIEYGMLSEVKIQLGASNGLRLSC